ncbi:sialidase family protein [Parapedobacter sp.]
MKTVLTNVLMGFAILGYQGSPDTDNPTVKWRERGIVSYGKIQHGIPVYQGIEGVYHRKNDSNLKISLGEPTIISVADREYGWGYFQFPSIYRALNGQLVVAWHMGKDAAESYGKGLSSFAVSDDEGKSWKEIEGGMPLGGGLELTDGTYIKNSTPVALKVSELDLLNAVDSNKEAYGRDFSYYRMSALPDALRGVYIARLSPGNSRWNVEHNVLNDPGVLRYTDGELFPVVWWGDMRIEAGGSVATITYPSFYEEAGKVPAAGVSFYRSTDGGRSWDVVSKIPYQPDLEHDPNGSKRLSFGFTEPAFEILKDSTYLCVLRTSDGLGHSPMYVSSSDNRGVTWTQPQVFAGAGVLPKLLQLGNGVVVLASGRPGVQLRFSTDGKGHRWTDPFEMLPFGEKNEHVSCGYTGLLPVGINHFLIVYSDFAYKTGKGEIRRAIKIREVTVEPSR